MFSCFRNPPNFDMDYMTFNVRTRSFFCVRIHTGDGHAHRQRVSTIFLTRKNSDVSCAPNGIRTSVLWIVSPTSTNWATPSPHVYYYYYVHYYPFSFIVAVICTRTLCVLILTLLAIRKGNLHVRFHLTSDLCLPIPDDIIFSSKEFTKRATLQIKDRKNIQEAFEVESWCSHTEVLTAEFSALKRSPNGQRC